MSDVKDDEVRQLRKEVALLQSALARIVIAQADAANAVAAFLRAEYPSSGSPPVGAGLLNINHDGAVTLSASIARDKILEASRQALNIVSEIVNSDGG